MMNLYERLKSKHKKELKEHGDRYPNTVKYIIMELKDEKHFTNVKYGTAWDIINICKLEFLGDAFYDR